MCYFHTNLKFVSESFYYQLTTANPTCQKNANPAPFTGLGTAHAKTQHVTKKLSVAGHSNEAYVQRTTSIQKHEKLVIDDDMK